MQSWDKTWRLCCCCCWCWCCRNHWLTISNTALSSCYAWPGLGPLGRQDLCRDQPGSINRQHSAGLQSVSLEPHKMFKVGVRLVLSLTHSVQQIYFFSDLRCLRPRRHSFCCRTSRIRSPRSLCSGEAPPPSLMLTSTEWLMTTARPTSRRQKHKMPTVLLPVASWLLFPMAGSRPPLTPLTMSTDSSLMSPTREPQSTPQSPQEDTARPPLMPQPPLTSPLLKLNTSQSVKKPMKPNHIWFSDDLSQFIIRLTVVSENFFLSSWKSFAGFQNISLPTILPLPMSCFPFCWFSVYLLLIYLLK